MTAVPTTKVLLLGAGGHARVCLEALRDDETIEVVGAVSTDGRGVDGLDIAVLGTDEDVESTAVSSGATTACVAIGNNVARLRVAHRWGATGRPLIDAVSRFAMISHGASWDPGVQLLPGAVVNAGTHLGTCTIVNTNASVDHDCRLGDGCHIAPGVALAGGVTIGDRVLVGIGARVVPGVSIGDDAVVGAGAVVTRDVAPGATVVGVPARVVTS